MAFKIFANALFVDTDFNPLRRGFSKHANVGITSSFDIKAFSPKDYLFSHCTIIASVDTEKDCSHHITLGTEKYINQNYDSWTRGTLKHTYRTFIGAPNYVEHVQVPELSKGTIVDAVLRDIKGETLYCDILVATHRKHDELVNRIKTGSMKAMSMGCIAAYTFCTQCGNKAHTENELCHHVTAAKGTKFLDKKANFRTVAEICGHESDPNSVKFIEASWVEVPAFTGAVLRNVVNIDSPILIKSAASSPLSALLSSAFRKSAAQKNQPLMGDGLEEGSPEGEQEASDEVLDQLFGGKGIDPDEEGTDSEGDEDESLPDEEGTDFEGDEAEESEEPEEKNPQATQDPIGRWDSMQPE